MGREDKGQIVAQYRRIQITVFYISFLISSFRFKTGLAGGKANYLI